MAANSRWDLIQRLKGQFFVCVAQYVYVLDYPFFSIIPKTPSLHLPWIFECKLEYKAALPTFSIPSATTRDG